MKISLGNSSNIIYRDLVLLSKIRLSILTKVATKNLKLSIKKNTQIKWTGISKYLLLSNQEKQNMKSLKIMLIICKKLI